MNAEIASMCTRKLFTFEQLAAAECFSFACWDKVESFFNSNKAQRITDKSVWICLKNPFIEVLFLSEKASLQKNPANLELKQSK
jgi:hypothetical protein